MKSLIIQMDSSSDIGSVEFFELPNCMSNAIATKNSLYQNKADRDLSYATSSSPTCTLILPNIQASQETATEFFNTKSTPNIENQIKSVSYEALTNLTKYLCGNIIPNEINEYSIIKNSNILIEKVPLLQCKHCSSLKLKVTLSCSHKSCIQCINNLIEKFVSMSSIKSFSNISCLKCKLNISENDLKTILTEKNFQVYKSIFKKVTCCRCHIKKVLATEYFTELTCLHLCKSCYADELFMGSTKCLCCNTPFLYIETTKKRAGECKGCNKKGLFVADCFRSFHKNHVMCYDCLNRSVQVCQVCEGNIGNKERMALEKYIYKSCRMCLKNYPIDYLRNIKCCGNLICEECFDTYKNCPICPVKF